MKIAIVNTHASGGGAARAAARLKQVLSRAGHDAFMYVQVCRDDEVVCCQPRSRKLNKVSRRLRSFDLSRSFASYVKTRSPWLELFSDDRSTRGGNPLRDLPGCDVVNLHGLAGFVITGSL